MAPPRAAWVRSKHPKPKPPTDPISTLLPALQYLSCQASAPPSSSRRRKKYLQNHVQPQIQSRAQTQLKARAQDEHIQIINDSSDQDEEQDEEQFEYYTPPHKPQNHHLDHRNHNHERAPRHVSAPSQSSYSCERETSRQALVKQKPRTNAYAARPIRSYTPYESPERAPRRLEPRSISAWSSAATALDL